MCSRKGGVGSWHLPWTRRNHCGCKPALGPLQRANHTPAFTSLYPSVKWASQQCLPLRVLGEIFREVTFVQCSELGLH